MDIYRNKEEALAGCVSAGEQDPSAQGSGRLRPFGCLTPSIAQQVRITDLLARKSFLSRPESKIRINCRKIT